jgi:ribosomal protein L1
MADAKKTSKAKQVKEAELIVEAVPAETEVEANISITKAGKHSAKALKEAEEKQAKEERKAAKPSKTEEAAKVSTKKAPRSRLERAGRKYRESAKLIDQNKSYELAEALELVTKTSPVKFDATVELHLNLGVDPKQADHNVRGVVALPAGTGKDIKVAVFAEADDAAKAKTAGADISGIEDITALLDKEKISFDVLIATPASMPKLGKYAKLLGPKGLMPNPKSGTVTNDVAKAVREAKAGQVEFRVDQAGIVHLGIGKVSFGAAKLGQNGQVVIDAIRAAKPSSLKGNYIESVFVTTSMGPSIKVAL